MRLFESLLIRFDDWVNRHTRLAFVFYLCLLVGLVVYDLFVHHRNPDLFVHRRHPVHSSLPCVGWHDMKIVTNDDAARRNDWFQAHSFRVRFDDARYLGEGVIHVTITVCKFCGKPVFKETNTKFVEH